MCNCFNECGLLASSCESSRLHDKQTISGFSRRTMLPITKKGQHVNIPASHGVIGLCCLSPYFTGGGILRTCALRPAGIYGPDERKIIGRMTVGVTYVAEKGCQMGGGWDASTNVALVTNARAIPVSNTKKQLPTDGCPQIY